MFTEILMAVEKLHPGQVSVPLRVHICASIGPRQDGQDMVDDATVMPP
jgi:hypothetical protein